METLVWGKSGFIGSHLSYDAILEKITFEVDPAIQILNILDQYKPDVIVNCTGYCGNKAGLNTIDDCENRKVYTSDINLMVPIYLAQACENRGVHLVQVSSGCIYNGPSPHTKISLENGVEDTGWKEEDVANPVSFYSETKAACDRILRHFSTTTLIRIRMPISPNARPRNLLSKLIKYKQIVEEPNSVTFVPDLVNCIDWTIQNKKYGIYNCCSPEPLTHSVLLEEYKKYNSTHTYSKITRDELDALTIAKRSNCIIDSSKIQNEGFKFGDTHERVRECVKQFCEDIKKENNGK